MRPKVWAVSVVVTASLLASFAREPERITFVCNGFHGTTSKDAIAYLRQDRWTLEPACIDDAISLLADDSSNSALNILLEYLDFETPVPPGAPHIVKVYRPTLGIYPATDLIVNFKSAALPHLKKIITNDEATTLSRMNAAKAYFWLNRNAAGIAFIAQAAHRTDDQNASKALLDLAKEMATHCVADIENACKEALDTQ